MPVEDLRHPPIWCSGCSGTPETGHEIGCPYAGSGDGGGSTPPGDDQDDMGDWTITDCITRCTNYYTNQGNCPGLTIDGRCADGMTPNVT